MDIREVARHSGVSVATVSRALNNRPDVSAATRQRVVAIAAELGYQPNRQARALARRRSELVGVVWDTSYLDVHGRHPFLQDLLVQLKIAFARTGRHLLLLSTAEPKVDSYVQIARQHSLAGLIVMGIDEGHPAITALLASSVPCVAVDLPLSGCRAGYVTSDNRAGAAAAVAHLHTLGHRRIATITGPLHLLPAAERLAGYRYQTALFGLPFRSEYIVTGDFFLDSGRSAMRRLLALPEPPTAVFAAGDEMAIGAMHVLAEAGVDVPGQLSMVGYDDVEAASLIRPALTTVAQDPRELAAAAALLLADLIAGLGPDGNGPRLVPNRLVIRVSSGPVPHGGLPDEQPVPGREAGTGMEAADPTPGSRSPTATTA
jgi:LacI family transcriptional regulator